MSFPILSFFTGGASSTLDLIKLDLELVGLMSLTLPL